MNSEKSDPDPGSSTHQTPTPTLLLCAAIGASSVLPAGAWQIATNFNVRAEATVKEGYDSNVYLQNVQPNLTLVPKAVLPFQGSFFTVFAPKLFIDYKPSAAFNLAATYSPEVSLYYATPSENNVANKMTLNLGGKASTVGWDLVNTLACIDGNSEGLYFGGPPTVGGNVPALGGIPIRDRRDATVYRGRYRATWNLQNFFIRPVTTAYVHDFHTLSLDNRLGQPNYGYENYVDRWEYAGGVDVGYEFANHLQVYAGYRRGNEDDGHMPGSPYTYDTKYNRPMGGIEGQPWPWLKLAVALGWDMHQTISHTPPGFDTDYAKLWSDTTVTFLPTAKDSIAIKFTRNTQPAFSSPSIYDDTVYDLLTRHTFDTHWAVGGGFRAYNGDWFKPVLRNDWIYTGLASVTYTHDKHLSTELTYSYDWTDCSYPPLDTAGREYTRNLVWLAVKYAF